MKSLVTQNMHIEAKTETILVDVLEGAIHQISNIFALRKVLIVSK